MIYQFESDACDLVRVTDGKSVRFIPVDITNAEYRLMVEGRPADERAGLPAIPPVTILEPES